MTIPQLSLLGFAMWTIMVPLGAVGVYRWTRIFAGSAAVHSFPADGATGADWYKRAMRAHANCVENLPVFASIVLLISMLGVHSRFIDTLSVVIILCRVAQSTVHMAFVVSARMVSVRFTFFFIQMLSMIALGFDVFLSAPLAR